MNKRRNSILIDSSNADVIRVGTINYNNQLSDIEYYTKFSFGKGSIHLGIVERVFPSLQAVFVRYKDSGKNGFLSFSEIDEIYLSDNKIISESISENFDENILDADMTDCPMEPDNKFLFSGQEIIVQVIKEERGSKGAMLSTFINLEGKFCVFIPNKSGRTTVSSQNNLNILEKKRIQLLLQNIKIPTNSSVIINQTGFAASKTEIENDIQELIKLWEEIKIKSLSLKTDDNKPVVLHYQFNIMREIFQNRHPNHNSYLQNIIVEGEETYDEAVDFAKTFMPTMANSIKFYNSDEEKAPIFTKYGIEKAIENTLSPVVSLRSGGYIVINRTEALIAIDVNSGKNRDENSIEETALKTNIEAIQEIMNQLKIRKVSGLIVIDLIGMRDFENNKIIEGIAWRMAQADKTKMQVILVPELSILIISKQRIENSLYEICEIPCTVCNKTGYIKNSRFSANEFFNEVRSYIYRNENIKEIKTFVSQRMLEILMNDYRNRIDEIEKQLSCKLNFILDLNFRNHQYKLENEDEKVRIENDNKNDATQRNDSFNKSQSDHKIIEEKSINSEIILDHITDGLFPANANNNTSSNAYNNINYDNNLNITNSIKTQDVHHIWNEWLNVTFQSNKVNQMNENQIK